MLHSHLSLQLVRAVRAGVSLALLTLAGSPALAQNTTATPAPASPASAASKPTLYIIGDSTANSSGAILGWGTPVATFFDPAKITVLNRARGGRSSRSFMHEGLWDAVLKELKAGDYVLLQFGHNDGGTPNADRAGERPSLPGLGDESDDFPAPTGGTETVHTYGWYMRKYIADAETKGAHLYVLTLTVRNNWSLDGKVERGPGQYSEWAREVAAAQQTPMVDLTNIVADKFDTMGKDDVAALYTPTDHTDTLPAGAELNAKSIVSGLKAVKGDPFGQFLSAKGQAVKAADAKYVAENTGVATTKPGATPPPPKPQPDSSTGFPRHTQMGIEAVEGAPGGGRYAPPVPEDTDLPTVWLIGDSTVRNGTLGDGSNLGQWGWGAPIVYYFNLSKINVVNRAFGGTSSRSFYEGFFWKNLQPQIKKGDFVIMQFGANDNGGASIKGVGDETQETTDRSGNPVTLHSFGWYLKQFVKETRDRGATPIICSLTPRKNWTPDGTRLRGDSATHAGWAAQVAKETDTPFVDLNELICRKYGELGHDKVDTLYEPSPKESLHTGWAGAVVNAECVISGLKNIKGDPLEQYFTGRGKAIAPAPDLSKP